MSPEPRRAVPLPHHKVQCSSPTLQDVTEDEGSQPQRTVFKFVSWNFIYPPTIWPP